MLESNRYFCGTKVVAWEELCHGQDWHGGWEQWSLPTALPASPSRLTHLEPMPARVWGGGGQPTMEGTAPSGWPSCIPYFLSSPESSLPNIWSTHLARTSAYWGHPISNQLPPPLRDFLSREAALLPLALQAGPASKAFTSWSTTPGV